MEQHRTVRLRHDILAAWHRVLLDDGEGEHLINFRDGGNIFIKADPVMGSNKLGLGIQQLPNDSGIPVNRHVDGKGR
ncbi:hypothetical protein ACRQ5Q_43320 (plasmid) [Bradyrhizobium sp. PMVTL-01]|uniref:hypothetical protein n=1 Tax=Bradyrhizobium sp. PMVTL-01 TaxID=3434999 RepID=UPI003F7030EB